MFSTFLECFQNVLHILTQCDTLRRLLRLFYDIEIMRRKITKDSFSVFYTLIKHWVLTNQSACRVLSINA